MTPGPNGNGWIGHYQLVEELGRGGQGAVYRARHAQSDQVVALKVLDGADRRAYKRFLQEGRVLEKLVHPNLPRVFEVGEAGRFPFLAMEVIEGENLEEQVKLRGLPEPDEIVAVLSAIGAALDYCHGCGVVHRDVKPENVLIESGSRRALLVDFGLLQRDGESLEVRALDGLSRMSVTGEFKGTPGYMAPEQADDETFGKPGPASDVYGVGGILYYLLTGHAPFEGAASYNLLVKLLREDPPPPSSHRADVNPELARLAMHALAKQPGDRPLSAGALTAELEAAIGASSGRGRGVRPGPLLAGIAVLASASLIAWLGLSTETSSVSQSASASPSAGGAEASSRTPLPERSLATPSRSRTPEPIPSVSTSPRVSPISPIKPGGAKGKLSFTLRVGDGTPQYATACPDYTDDGVGDYALHRGPRDTTRARLDLVSGADGSLVWTSEKPISLWTRAHAQKRPFRALVVGRYSPRTGQTELAWLDPKKGSDLGDAFNPAGERRNLSAGGVIATESGSYVLPLYVKKREKGDPPLHDRLVETNGTTVTMSVSIEGLLQDNDKITAYRSRSPVVIGPRRVAWYSNRTAYAVDLDSGKSLWKVTPSDEIRGQKVKLNRRNIGWVLPEPGPKPKRLLVYWQLTNPPGIELVVVSLPGGEERRRDYFPGKAPRRSEKHNNTAAWLDAPYKGVEHPILVACDLEGVTRARLIHPQTGADLGEKARVPRIMDPPKVVRCGSRSLIVFVSTTIPTIVQLRETTLDRVVWQTQIASTVGPKTVLRGDSPRVTVADLDGDGQDEIGIALPTQRRFVSLSPIVGR